MLVLGHYLPLDFTITKQPKNTKHLLIEEKRSRKCNKISLQSDRTKESKQFTEKQ